MHITFTFVKLLISLIFGAVCGTISGLFMTRSQFKPANEIDGNEEDMTFYSRDQMDKFGIDYFHYSEEKRKKVKGDSAKPWLILAVSAVVWVGVLVLMILTSEAPSASVKKVNLNVGVGDMVSAGNAIVDIKVLPVTSDTIGNLAIPYEITNKMDKSLETVFITCKVNDTEMDCRRMKVDPEDPEGLTLIDTEDPVVPGSTAKFYISVSGTAIKKKGIDTVTSISLTFDTCTIDWDNNGVMENETQLEMIQVLH